MGIPLAAYSGSRGDFMLQKYDLLLGSKAVGTVCAEKQGLYYRFSCRCNFADPGIYKVIASGEKGEVNLGTCLHMKTGFGLETRVPVKALGAEKLSFRVQAPAQEADEVFVPINSENPFAYIARLHGARLTAQNGKTGILLKGPLRE